MNASQGSFWVYVQIQETVSSAGGNAAYLVHHPKTDFVLVHGMKAKHSDYLMQVHSKCINAFAAWSTWYPSDL